jgi:hypothetical protein
MSVVWYQLYGFLVGRGYDRDGESSGYYFSTYIVLPYGTRLTEARKSPEGAKP